MDPLGRGVEVGLFSGASKPSTSATPTLGTTTTPYDAEYTTVTDPAGKKRRSLLDGLGRLVRVDEPTGSPGALGTTGSPNQATSYSYSALDNLTRVTQGSQTRTFVYDSLSRLTSAANPESGAIAYTYDNNGNLTRRTDARSVVTTYTYDGLDRLTRRSYSYTGSETAVSLETTRVDYAYDSCGNYSRGRLCSVMAKKGATQVSRTAYNRYDALGRVLESTQTTGGQPYTMAYAYDRAGNLIRQRYPSERVVDYVYDGAGRIAGVKTGADGWYAGGTGDNAVGYEPHGGVKQLLLGNGLWEQRRYNVRLQPTQIGLGTTKATGSLTATGPTPTAGLLLLDYSYGASSNNGNVLSQRIRVGTSLNQNQVYTYDALNRLKTAGETGSGTAWSQTYTYDRYGNRRVTAGASHGSNQALTPQSTADIAAGTNRLAGTKGVNTIAYDWAGNLTADWAGNSFKYDGDNRMVAFDTAGTDSDTTYAYDGEGRRVRKVVGGSSGIITTYVYNVGGQLLAEFGGTAPDQPGTRYLTPDHLGSTRVVTAEDQSVLSRHDYLPFGEEIGAAYGGRSSVSGYTANRTDGPAQKFTGKERDNESGLHYFGARYFSGAGGRFTSPDLINVTWKRLVNPGNTLNKYSYAANNPLLYVDPDGQDVTVFYRASGKKSITDWGHILIAVTNQKTGQVKFLDYSSESGRDKPWTESVRGVMGTVSSEGLRKHAALTIRTTPEQAQKMIDAIEALEKNVPNYFVFTSNCAMQCLRVLELAGLEVGLHPLHSPEAIWRAFYQRYSAEALRHGMFVPVRYQPGVDFGLPMSVYPQGTTTYYNLQVLYLIADRQREQEQDDNTPE